MRRLVQALHDEGGGDGVTLRCIKPGCRGLAVVVSGLDAKTIRATFDIWPEALALAARACGVSSGECVPRVNACYRRIKRRKEVTRYTTTMVVVNPAEIVDVKMSDGSDGLEWQLTWSDGHEEKFRHFHQHTWHSIEAHRLLGVLYELQRVEAFAGRDGDHAIGVRVVQFLVKPGFLRRD